MNGKSWPHFLYAFVASWLILSWSASAFAEMTYIYSAPFSENDARNDFKWEILGTALQRTQNTYGSFVMRPAAKMSSNRQVSELERHSDAITIMVLDPTPELEERLLPIRIPIDRGLIGYRVLLIRQGDQSKFDTVRSLVDLKKIRIGQESDWSDVETLRKNGLTVETGSSYEGLFSMLARGRFDCFLRGATEVVGELDSHRIEFPDMRIEKRLVLHYPLPIYFWFSKTPDGVLLAKRVEEGMRSMLADGTYDNLFWQYYRPVLEHLDLPHRRLIEMKNPFLIPETPLADESLWIDPMKIKPEH